MKKDLGRKYSSIIQLTIFMFCISSVCVAGVEEFNDINDFNAVAGNPQYFIDFESYGDGTPVVGQPTIDGNEWSNLEIQFAAVESGADLVLFEPPTKPEYVSPTHTLMPSGDRSSYSITFPTPVVSFGVYIVDSEITSTNEKIILKDSNGNIIGEFPMPVNPNGTGPPISKEFRGYISDIPIAEVRIIEDADGEGLGLDNVMYSVLEPAALDIVWVFIDDPGVPTHESFTGYMSKYETTNAQYCQFLNDALASDDIGDITVSDSNVYGASGKNGGADFVDDVYYDLAGPGFTDYGATNGGAARINYAGGFFSVDPGFEDHPVTYVSWYGATAFCNYYGYRLPTEWEWQAVADHTVADPYDYGCGPNINNSIANYLNSTHPDGTTVVGSFGSYGYGMCDMAGNVLEWTSTGGIYRIVRSGCWFYGADDCTVSSWSSGTQNHSHHNVGFRVVQMTYYVSDADGNDANDGWTRETAFATIQKGIETANNGDTILVYPGTYAEEIEFLGKAVAVRGVEEAGEGLPVIEAPAATAVSFYEGEDADSILEHFIITNSFNGLWVSSSAPTINHVTVVDNNTGLLADEPADPDVQNSIFHNNSLNDFVLCDPTHTFYNGDTEGAGIAYWKFDEGEGTTAYDSIGNNDGTLINGPNWTTGQVGGALEFDGAGDYVDVPDAPELNPTNAITVTAWFNVSSFDYGTYSWPPIVKKSDNDQTRGYALEIVQVYQNNPCMSFAVELEGQGPGLRGVPTEAGVPMLIENTWYFAAGVYDGSAVKVYVGTGGEPLVLTSANYSGSIVPSSNNLNIGRDPSNTSRDFEGLIDEVRIYNRALSAEELRELQEAGDLGYSYEPLFVDPNNGDYRLLSERGRYWAEHDVWVLDDVSSPCIDAGDPAVYPSIAPTPNGGRINMGAYGNTSQASMSEWLIAEDNNRDGIVNMIDMAMLANKWLDSFEWF